MPSRSGRSGRAYIPATQVQYLVAAAGCEQQISAPQSVSIDSRRDRAPWPSGSNEFGQRSLFQKGSPTPDRKFGREAGLLPLQAAGDESGTTALGRSVQARSSTITGPRRSDRP